MKKSRKHFALIILLIMASSLAIANSVIAAPSNATTWNVLAGGQTSDMALQGLGFYPGVITINEGDTINWTLGGNLVHTISFLSGIPPPSPDSQDAVTPSGDSTYDGTGLVSSGLLTPGVTYSLTFTKAGIYIYQCLLHPGMSGLVIVQQVNSSYPSNQAQYTAQGNNELLSDIDTGQKLANNLSLTTSSEPGGTTMFHVPADIPLSTDTSVVFGSNNSNVTGSATLNFTGAGILLVQMQLSGLASNSAVSANIYVGTNNTGDTVLYSLNNITADINGSGNSTTIINPGFVWFAIASKGWFINVLNGTIPIANGNIVMHDAMYARFTPTNLTVHAGDQVEWTAYNPMEIHTVTFPGAEQLPVFPNPDAVTPAGGNIHNGTGFYNSGILHVGDKYTLTFKVPGNYGYACVVHDDLGMAGNIAVELPINPVITDFVVTPDTAISEINPAIESGNVAVGINNIMQVEFGIIDINNLTGTGGNGSAILVFDRNITGGEGLYQSEPWGGNFAVMSGNMAVIGNMAVTGNVAVPEPITVYTTSDAPGFFQARGTFNDSKTSTEAILWFDKATLNLSNVTDVTGTALNIKDGSSTFMGKTFKYINGTISDIPELTSGQIFNLFNSTGNMNSNNPVLMFKDVPQDKYKAYVIARDSGGNSTTMVTDIDTIIPSVPSGGGISRGGGSSGGGFNSQGNGTYFGTGNQGTGNQAPSETLVPTPTEVTPFPTVSPEATTVQATPIATATKGAPGFEVIAAIGMISAIYIFARKRR